VAGDDGEDQGDGELESQEPRRCAEVHGRFVSAEKVLNRRRRVNNG
jgi:hypothetical protein